MSSRSSTRKKLERLLSTPGAGPPVPDTDAGKHESLYRLEREILGEAASPDTRLSVKERLERLVSIAGRAEPGRPSRESRGGRRVLSLDEVLNGRSVANERGELYRVDHEFPLHHRHGKVSLSRLNRIPPDRFSLLARGDADSRLDLSRAVFLDTETTGLTGGSGTCAFLIGTGYIEKDTFRVRQLFMRDYAEEEAMLWELTDLLDGFESLVTFNGRSFDVPLLESRYVLSRLPYPLSEVTHFDLLHPARNLWKARLESCRLTELEYVLLGHERDDDVPGELIPGLYFDYIRSKDASRIFRVFAHNCHDILSLAALTVRALEMLDEDAAPEHALDDYSLGRVFELASQPERSMMHYTRAVQSGVGGAARRRSLRQLAEQHKRRGEIGEAVALWRELSEEEGPEAIEALEELAMVLEHRDRDFSGALDCCERAISRIEVDRRLRSAFRERHLVSFRYRRRRLERRIKRGG